MFKRQADATSIDGDRPRAFIKRRPPGHEMEPLGNDDFTAPRQRQPRQGPPNRKGRGAQQRDQDRYRANQNERFQQELSDHFAQKINFADKYREAFTVVGRSGVVSQPDRVVEIETAGVRQVVFDCVEIAKSKKDVFTPDFVPALLHVTAHQVAAKLEHAHMRSTLGSTASEQIPRNHQVVEHVRCASMNTLIGVAGYLDHVGNFMDDTAMVTPYLRRLVRGDSGSSFDPSDIMLHHVPQLYSEAYRSRFLVPPAPAATYQQRIEAIQPYRDEAAIIGIPLPEHDAPGPGPGRDLVDDLRIVQHNILLIQSKYKEIVVSVDVSTGKGSRSQHVAYTEAKPFEQNHVWSALAVDAMDLYVGAAFGFCIDRLLWTGAPLGFDPPDNKIPPEHHLRLARRQMHVVVPGSIHTWVKNLMLRG
jgi:hypothetical protein